MLQKLFYLPFIAGFFLANYNQIPPDQLEQLVQKFYSFYSQHPQQKIYVQTDRPYYLSGDELFGKIYLINENADAAPDSMRSKKIYVELINDENTVVQKVIVNGLSSSQNFSFHLPDSIANGNYLLRAYTAWMIQYGDNTVFSTYIPILNKATNIKTALAYKDSTLSTLVVQLTDTLKNGLPNERVSYQLLYKNNVLAKEQINTDAKGRLFISVNRIPKQQRNKAALKIQTGDYKKWLPLPIVTNDIDVQFLLEGGNLINDLDNTVAFKAINQQGRGIDVEGYVEDNTKAVLCKFKSAHLGMGQFNFVPKGYRSYTVVLNAGGRTYNYSLEPANNYGYQVAVVKRTNNAVTVRIALGDSLYQKGKITYLIASAHGTIYFTSRGQDMYEVEVPLQKVPEGITQLTLFDEAMQPVSERLIYVSQPHPVVHIATDKTNYKKREKVTVQLQTEKGKSLQGIYALSVTDDHVVKPDENAANIKTQLLLSPYLQGYIEEPGYYFKADDSTTQQHLDLVMRTHGWSRFTWQAIVDDNVPTRSHTKDSSLAISGTLLDKANAPLSHYRINLFSKTDNVFISADTTDEKGDFFFPGIDFTDSTSFFIQIKNPKGGNEDVTVVINPQHFPLTEIERPIVPKEIPDQFQTNINYYVHPVADSLRYGALQEVVINAVKKKVDYNESKRVSPGSYVIPRRTVEQYSDRSVMDLMYLVPGATFFNGHVSFFGTNGTDDSANPFTDPLIILDGIENPAGASVDLHTVDFIEVLRGPEAAIYGVRGGNGVIVINTKEGKEGSVYFAQNGIKTLQVPGYHVEREFYAPKYESEESRLSKKEDARITIYWNGHINTDSNGNATLSFYTADASTTYTITLEGIMQNGTYIHQTASINRTE